MFLTHERGLSVVEDCLVNQFSMRVQSDPVKSLGIGQYVNIPRSVVV